MDLLPFNLCFILLFLGGVRGLGETLMEQDDGKASLTSSEGMRSSDTSPVVCPPPYFRVMSECFYVHTKHPLSWDQARIFCQGMEGDLAQPRHLNALLAVISEKYESGPYHLWLGASDHETEGVFQWVSGGHVTSGWREDQPDDFEEGEDCLEMWTAKFPCLSDKHCDLKSAFICQYM